MAYHYESYQTSLPPTVSAGWNDPPTLNAGAPASGASSRLLHMRRPVDPSITGPTYGAVGHHGYGHANPGFGAPAQQTQQNPGFFGYPGLTAQPTPTGYESAAGVNYQQAAQTYSTGQHSPYGTTAPLTSTVGASVTAPPTMNQGFGMPSAAQTSVHSSFPPQVSPVISQPSASPAAVQHSNIDNITSPHYPTAESSPYDINQQLQATAMPSAQHRAIYDAFTVNSMSSATFKADPFLVRPQSSAPSVPIPSAASHAAWAGATTQTSRAATFSSGSQPVMTQPLESNPQSLIFAPPNAVGEVQPGVPIPTDPIMYNRVPVKAAGDVSLTGPQLVLFLMKATTRLPQAKCEGVRLRLNQLQELIQQGRLSDPCLKKLNFVVDAIDRGLLDEATGYFDQLQAQFPQELGTWGQGVRLLIGELRGPAGRVGSAGAHMFLSRALRGNLNRRHWNRRVWEIGYRGPLLAQQKATGRPDYPIQPDQVVVLRDRLTREFGVMKMLTRPYEAEQDYFASLSVSGLEDLRQRKAANEMAEQMPGQAKRVDGSKTAVRRRANIGNLLHTHSTVEDSLASLTNRNRWD